MIARFNAHPAPDLKQLWKVYSVRDGRAKLLAQGLSEERLAEADYYARKCGITLDEVLRIIEAAYSASLKSRKKRC
ncbi:hypothetical protein [Mesorhizobium sp.]|uniref:hypothetical protein n=1 Tax=Mesorhizobium sp. TaxID=1871066 RepID=UPI000FE4384D|nr:hypothetical protein [Mesorhizobium sp.]RWK09896.1 MAG: hypothetical protein EOR42_00015 [Mesorhizobium sp.]